MDADRGPEAGGAVPSESEAGNDGPQSNARSHPLRRMIGSEPAAADASSADEIDALLPPPAPAAPAAPQAPAQPPQAAPGQAAPGQPASAQPAAPAGEASEDDVAGASSLAGLAIRRNQPGKSTPRPAPAAGQAAPQNLAVPPQGANGGVKTPAAAQVQGRANAPAPAPKAPAVPVSAPKSSAPKPSPPKPQAAAPQAPAAAPGSKPVAPQPQGGGVPQQRQVAAETPAPAAAVQAPNGAGARASNGTGAKAAVSIRKQPEPAPEVEIRKAGGGAAKSADQPAARPAPTEAMKPSASIRKAPAAEAPPAAAAQAEAPKPAAPEAPVSSIPTPGTPTPGTQTPGTPTPPAATPAAPKVPAPEIQAPEIQAPEVQARAVAAPEAPAAKAAPEVQAAQAAPEAPGAPAKARPAPAVAVKAPQAAPPVEEARQVDTPVVQTPAREAPAVQTPAVEAPAVPPPATPAPPVAEAPPDLDLTPTDDLIFDEDGAMRIGYITSVSGRKVYGVMIPDKDVVSEESMLHLQEVSQIGDLVKMPTSKSVAFGMISSLEIRNPSSSPPAATDQRVLEIDLFGEGIYSDDGEFKFQRGISVYPSLGTEIRETTHEELAQIYARPSESNVLIGSLYQDNELPAYLLVDDLLGKHFAVLGTTGTGKSCSTTVILRSILDAHPNGHVVLMDPHNEYGQAFDEYAEVVRPDTLSLPFWLLNFEELVEVVCTPDQSNRKAEVNILKEAVYASKLQFVGDSDDVTTWLTVDTPVPYRLSTLIQLIEDAQGQLDRPEDSAPYHRLRARIQALRADRRYDFMFAGLSVKDSMAEVLARLLRIPVEGRPITILQLSGVPSEIVDVVVSLLCRMVFDFAMWSMGQQSVPVLLVCEEAHRYIPQDQATGFAPTRKAIARIAKEGRKYGVSLCLVTQRPSELSETILSQCNTIFTLRMSNERDQVFVRRAMPDSAAGMLNALPALRNQECIVVGEGVSVPMRIRFLDLEPYNRPQSDTAVFSDAWEYDQERGESFLHDVVDRWRRQSF